ncbi:MAG: hypothetical protein ACLQUY_09865 [Ktedonobacterales bacterium]
MMQRTDMLALAAGATVGVVGGALGAFLVCTAGPVVAGRFLNQLNEQYLDLGQPAPPTARHSDQSPRMVPVLSRDSRGDYIRGLSGTSCSAG